MLVFFDDILVYNTNLDTHLEHLKLVFATLREHQLYDEMSKCSFGKETVEYLGHIVSKQGVSVDPEKVRVVKEWPTPSSVKELMDFLGLSGYYRKFVKAYGFISKPLTTLLQKYQFKWSLESE